MSRSVESAQQNALFSCKGSPGSPICDYWTISGLLFLPAAGAIKGGVVVYAGQQGTMASRNAYDGSWPWYVLFRPASMGQVRNDGNFMRSGGKSVRLCCLAQ